MKILWNDVFLKKNPSQHNTVFWKVLNYKVQVFAYINQAAQEIWDGAVFCLSIWKSTLSREILLIHGTQAVSHSLVRNLLTFGMWICLKYTWDIIPSAHQFLAKPQRESQLWNSYLMDLNRTLMKYSCLSEDRIQRPPQTTCLSRD